MQRALGVASLLVLLLARAALAREGDDAVKEAGRYFDLAKAAVEDGRYTVAIPAFEAAYKLLPRPSTAYGLAAALRLQYAIDHDPWKLLRAVALFKEVVASASEGDARREKTVVFLADLEPELARIEEQRRREGKKPLAEALPAVDEARTQLVVSSSVKAAMVAIDGGAPVSAPAIVEVRPGPHQVRVSAPGYLDDEVEAVAVEGRLISVVRELHEKQGLLSLRAPAGAAIEVDGRAMGLSPLAGAIQLPAGKHVVVVTRRGHQTLATELTIGRAENLALETSMPRTTQRVVSYYFAGATALAALAGGGAGWIALAAAGRAREVETKLAGGMLLSMDEVAAHDRDERRNDTYRNFSYLCFGSAAALLATTGILYWFDSPRSETSMGPTLVPIVGDRTAGLSVEGTFGGGR